MEKKINARNKNDRQKTKILMVGVGPKCIGGMWSVAQSYMNDKTFMEQVDATYIPTASMGSKIVRLLYMLIGYVRILWQLIVHRPSLVHIHMAEKGSVYRKGLVVKMSKLFGCKVLVHMHAGPFMSWYKTKSARTQKWVSRMLNQADKVLVLGKYWADTMEEILPKEKMEVLYNGVEVPTERLYNLNAQNIAYFGVINKDKGVPELLEAMKLLDEKLPTKQMLLLYGKDLDGDLERRIKALQLENRVRYCGWIDAKQRDEALKDAMLSVLPSHFEGLSMSIIEAMSYGVPVVTTNISTMPELVGEDIHLIEVNEPQQLANEIERYCTDEELRETCSLKLYERAKEKFTLEQTINALLETYRQLTVKEV